MNYIGPQRILILTHNFSSGWPDEKSGKYLCALPKVLQDEILKFKPKESKLSRLVGKLLLKEGLKLFKNSHNALSNLTSDSRNKPYIPNAPHFNISHSGSQVVCAISQRYPIGIDIEKIKPVEIDNFSKVLSDKEVSFIKKHKEPNEAFFDIWTQKEAVMKADGRGIIPMLMKNISIEGNKASLIKDKVWFLHKCEIHQAYKSHIATIIEKPDIEVLNIDFP